MSDLYHRLWHLLAGSYSLAGIGVISGKFGDTWAAGNQGRRGCGAVLYVNSMR